MRGFALEDVVRGAKKDKKTNALKKYAQEQGQEEQEEGRQEEQDKKEEASRRGASRGMRCVVSCA
jgi:hypothetical protein